jgi:hypothetical protein
MNLKAICIVLGLLLLVCFLGAPLSAQTPDGDITVQTEGFGISKQDALLKAKRNAVEKGIGTVLISHTEIKNFELQKDIILSKTIGSVKHYDILKEQTESDGSIFIQINALVSLASIKADLAALKILLESMDKPRMMVLIREVDGKTAENTIISFLKDKSFDLVDAASVAALLKMEEGLINRAVQGDPGAAAQIGAKNGAEYLIVGSVTKSLKETKLLSESGMISGQASISAKVINCTNARVVASNSASAAAYHVSEKVAMANASEKAAEKLMDRKLFETIVATFQDMINNGFSLDITVNNVPNFKTQKSVREFLVDLPNVVSVTKKAFGGGALGLTVLYKGNADAFSELVDGKTAAGKMISVTDIAANSVTLLLE